MTRSSAGTQSSISLTLSPMTCSAATQQLQIMLSISRRTSSRGKWLGNGLRREGRSSACFSPRGRVSSSRAKVAVDLFERERQLVGIKALGPMAELRPLQLFDDRFQALDLAVAVLDGGSHIANKMLQMSRFGRQIVGIEMHARIYPIRVLRRSDFVRFYAGFCSFLALQSRLPYAFEDRQSVPSSSIASCAGESVTVPPGSLIRGQMKPPWSSRLVNRQRPLPSQTGSSTCARSSPGTQTNGRGVRKKREHP